MSTYRSASPWTWAQPPVNAPFPTTLEWGTDVGDGTEFIVGLTPDQACDADLGWRRFHESTTVSIDGIGLKPGAPPLSDPQMPVELAFIAAGFEAPYTPVQGPDYTRTVRNPIPAVLNEIAATTGSARHYLGKLVQDFGAGDVDVAFYAYVSRSYAMAPWTFHEEEGGKFWSNSTLTITVQIHIEADLSGLELGEGVQELFVLHVSGLDGTSPIHPPGSTPSSGFIITRTASSLNVGSEWGEIAFNNAPFYPPIKLYIPDQPAPEEEALTVEMSTQGCELFVERYGARPDI